MRAIGQKSGGCALIIALMSLAVSSPARAEDRAETPARLTSIIRLIAVPEQYDGRLVATIGVLSIRPRESMLYVSPVDANHTVMPNGLIADFSDGRVDLEYARQFNGRFVFVRGVFRVNNDRYRRIPAGVLGSIEEIYGQEDWVAPENDEE